MNTAFANVILTLGHKFCKLRLRKGNYQVAAYILQDHRLDHPQTGWESAFFLLVQIYYPVISLAYCSVTPGGV